MPEHNVARIWELTRKNIRIQELEALVHQQAETIEQLGEKNRLLQNTVKMGQQELNNAYKRIAELIDVAT